MADFTTLSTGLKKLSTTPQGGAGVVLNDNTDVTHAAIVASTNHIASTSNPHTVTAAQSGAVANAGSSVSIQSDVFANRPAFGSAGRMFNSTDTQEIFYDDGTQWITMSQGGVGLNNVVEDVTPQLGGNLDLNGYTVGSATAADLTKLNSVTASAAELNYTNGVTSNIQTQLNAKLENVVEDTTPQLGGELDAQSNKIVSLADGTALTDAATLGQTKMYVDSADPTANDDASNTAGNGTFVNGDFWLNETDDGLWILQDETAASAVWLEVVVLNAAGELTGTLIQLSDTAANLAAVVLEEGQIALATDTRKVSIGDGVTAFASLENLNAAGGAGAISGGTVQGISGTYDIRATNEGTVAGNARGDFSFDVQTQRSSATQVASGTHSSIVGGFNNTVSSNYSGIFSGGGGLISASENSSIVGGSGNEITSTGHRHFIAGGSSNVISGTASDSAIIAGTSAEVSADNGLAIGNSAIVTATGAVQIGAGTNAQANTLRVGTGPRLDGTAPTTNAILTTDVNDIISSSPSVSVPNGYLVIDTNEDGRATTIYTDNSFSDFDRLIVRPDGGNRRMNFFFLPSGTETQSSIQVSNSEDADNRGRINLRLNDAEASLIADALGTGTAPTIFSLGLGSAGLTFNSSNNIGIGTTSPDAKLDVNGAITQRELSSDPADPNEGSFVTWMSDGSGSGDDGDIMMKITAGAVTKTVTIVDFSAS